MSEDHLNSVTMGDSKRRGTISRIRLEPKILEVHSESIHVNAITSPGSLELPDVENLVIGDHAFFWSFFDVFYPSIHDGPCAVLFWKRRPDGIPIEPFWVWADDVKPFFHDGSRRVIARHERSAGHWP